MKPNQYPSIRFLHDLGIVLLGIIRAHFDPIHRTIASLDLAAKVPLPRHPEIVLDYQGLLGLEAWENQRVPSLVWALRSEFGSY